jgi:heme-degrading monooxygenase HmoA
MMFAVVGRVKMEPGRLDEVTEMASNVVLPMVKSQPGHVASYFTRSADGTNGMSMSLFETKEQANESAASMNTPPGAPVALESVEVREVIANG